MTDFREEGLLTVVREHPRKSPSRIRSSTTLLSLLLENSNSVFCFHSIFVDHSIRNRFSSRKVLSEIQYISGGIQMGSNGTFCLEKSHLKIDEIYMPIVFFLSKIHQNMQLHKLNKF